MLNESKAISFDSIGDRREHRAVWFSYKLYWLMGLMRSSIGGHSGVRGFFHGFFLLPTQVAKYHWLDREHGSFYHKPDLKSQVVDPGSARSHHNYSAKEQFFCHFSGMQEC